MKHACRPARRAALVVAVFLLLPLGAAASKPLPVVRGSWQGAPSSVPLGRDVELVLRITADESASNLTIDILPTAGVEVLSGTRQWTGSLAKGKVFELPFTVKFVANGEWTLGASITNRRPDDTQVSGAVLKILAKNGVATLST